MHFPQHFPENFPGTHIEPAPFSGVSISRGPTPLSSPGGRNSRSPSLSMPPASPVARRNRVRSASLAVASHKTPPHSPGSPHEIFFSLCFVSIGVYWKRKMEHYKLHISFETLRLISQGQDCQVVCRWHPVCPPTDPSREIPVTSTSPPALRTTSPGWAPSHSPPARLRPSARSFIFRWELSEKYFCSSFSPAILAGR